MSVKLLAGRYELIEKIGDGGMAIVYKARCRLLNRYVAIKILKPEYTKDVKVLDNFRRESQAAASLSHPNIVNIYDVGREGNIHYIVMELIEGMTLADMIEEEAPMPYKKVINITRQIAAGLSFAHKNNIIHRDIKPHNILMTQDGVAKIADFGIAKAISESTIMKNTTGDDMVMGSVHYFSPEQARGGYVDAKSDIYSLGIVMYEMLTGRVPFDADSPVAIALMHMNDPMTPPSYYVSGIPPRLENIIMKATDKVQVNRFATVDELIRELDNIEMVSRVVGESAIAPEKREERREAAPERQPEKKQKHEDTKTSGKKLPVIIAAAAAAVILIVAGILVFGGGDKNEVKVPNLTDMTYEEAEAELEELGLQIEMGNEVFSDEYDEGRIVSQSPKADMKVKKGKTIRVNISKGSGVETVPSVIGQTVEQARATLEAKGFSLGSVKEEESDSPEGTVISQSPDAGTEAESSQAVSVVISKGRSVKEVAMPGLLGKSLDAAKAEIEAAGLKVGSVTYGYSDDYPSGQVIEQQYSSGTSLAEGTSVGIKVSKGPEPQPDEPEEEEAE